MGIAHTIRGGLRRIGLAPYRLLDRLYLSVDKRTLRRTRNLRLIPAAGDRTGGKRSYAEWAHVVGIFQTLLFLHLEKREENRVLDVGCGTGLMGIASEPFLGAGGKYVGIDVLERSISYCRRHFPSPPFEFVHLRVANRAYAPSQGESKRGWPVESGSFDMVTALSVWTHFVEDDAVFYFREVARALRPGGKAILTFFLLDRTYRDGLSSRTGAPGRFHRTPQDRWIFDRPCDGSGEWLHPGWTKVPESAVGVTEAGLECLLADSGMERIEQHPGNWKEVPGAFFQDVLVFRKR